MTAFKPCQGKAACRDDGVRCLTCGRTLHEIMQLRNLIDNLANLADEYMYENIQEYTAYVARKVDKTINYRRQELTKSCPT